MRLSFGVLGLVLALAGCDREPEAIAPPRYPQPVQGNQPNYGDADWAARRSWLTAMMPEVEVRVRDVFVRQSLPSLVAGVLVDGQLVWWQGFGNSDLEDGGPVDNHTVYRVGGITQVVTAMAALKLRDDGKLSLDAAASGYIPELAEVKCPTSDCPPITARHLLTHTAGLPRLPGFEEAGAGESPMSERDVVEGLRGLVLERAPGTEAVYSNVGYALLGLVVARAAGESLEDYADRTILGPLGMRATAWVADQVPHDRLATGYAFEGGQYAERPEWRMGAAQGMGGLYSSLDDLARFLGYEMTAWPPGARPAAPPLSSATLRESQRLGGFQAPTMDGVGLGWMVARSMNHELIHHDGGTDGYGALVMFMPEMRIGFVALTNTGKPGVLAPLAQEVLGFLQQRIESTGTPKPVPRRAGKWRP